MQQISHFRSWLKTATILFVATFAALAFSQTALIDRPIAALKGAIWDGRNTFSIGDKPCHFGLWADDRGGFRVYDIGTQFSRLKGLIGVKDGFNGTGHFTISIDGKQVAFGTVYPNHVSNLNLNVAQASSVRVSLTNCTFGEPTLYTADEIDSTSAKPEGKKNGTGTSLLGPPDKAVISGSEVQLSWRATPGAVCYGIELVCMTLNSGNPNAERLKVYTVHDTLLSVAVQTLEPGTYRWTVISFGPHTAIGGFGSERTFTIGSGSSFN